MTNYKDALKQYIAATNSHDFSQVKKILHPDAVYWFTDKTCMTHEEIGDYFNNAWSIIKEETYSAADVQWVAVDDRAATCIYTFHYEGYLDGKFVSGSGRATNVFKTVNGQWTLIHEHLSSLND